MNNVKLVVKFSANVSFTMPGSPTSKSRLNFSSQMLSSLIDKWERSVEYVNRRPRSPLFIRAQKLLYEPPALT
jgi:hypothetical protein